MGMTDKQFEAYQQRLLRELEKIDDEIKRTGKTTWLKQLMTDIENQLKKP